MAQQRERPTDRIIDLAIALESLFARGTELSYRYATNCAALLEDVSARHFEVFSFIKKFYELRSTVAHGEDPSTSSAGRAFGVKRREIDDNLKRVTKIVEELLRLHVLNHKIRTDAGKTAHLLDPQPLITDAVQIGVNSVVP
jgi:hypothetical protein